MRLDLHDRRPRKERSHDIIRPTQYFATATRELTTNRRAAYIQYIYLLNAKVKLSLRLRTWAWGCMKHRRKKTRSLLTSTSVEVSDMVHVSDALSTMKSIRYPLHRRLDGPQSRYKHRDEEKHPWPWHGFNLVCPDAFTLVIRLSQPTPYSPQRSEFSSLMG
jgi:hypothetical protein